MGRAGNFSAMFLSFLFTKSDVSRVVIDPWLSVNADAFLEGSCYNTLTWLGVTKAVGF
jgi:hypothetical protein